jgi:hypothetical protein
MAGFLCRKDGYPAEKRRYESVLFLNRCSTRTRLFIRQPIFHFPAYKANAPLAFLAGKCDLLEEDLLKGRAKENGG